jgi:hypothetical protein
MTRSTFNFENFEIINKYLKMTKTVTCSSKEELNCFFFGKRANSVCFSLDSNLPKTDPEDQPLPAIHRKCSDAPVLSIRAADSARETSVRRQRQRPAVREEMMLIRPPRFLSPSPSPGTREPRLRRPLDASRIFSSPRPPGRRSRPRPRLVSPSTDLRRLTARIVDLTRRRQLAQVCLACSPSQSTPPAVGLLYFLQCRVLT